MLIPSLCDLFVYSFNFFYSTTDVLHLPERVQGPFLKSAVIKVHTKLDSDCWSFGLLAKNFFSSYRNNIEPVLFSDFFILILIFLSLELETWFIWMKRSLSQLQISKCSYTYAYILYHLYLIASTNVHIQVSCGWKHTAAISGKHHFYIWYQIAWCRSIDFNIWHFLKKQILLIINKYIHGGQRFLQSTCINYTGDQGSAHAY